MTYIDCWKEVNDVRWLIYLIDNNKRLKEDYGINLNLRKFTLSVAKDVNEFSGKENTFYEEVRYLTCVDLVTGIQGQVIEEKRESYYRKMAYDQIKIKDTFEFNSYFSLLDNNSLRSAFNTYNNAINFIKNLSDNNVNIVNDFRKKLADDFRNIVGEVLMIDDQYDICPSAITDMNKYCIFPDFFSHNVYFDYNDKIEDNCKNFYAMWEKEKNIKWLIYLYFNFGKVNEEKIRQFTLDTVVDLITRTGSERLLEVFQDNLKMIQDAIYGILRKDVVAATSKKDNVMPHNFFGEFWNMMNCAINSLKFENVESAVAFAFYFIYRGIKSKSIHDKSFLAKMTGELTEKFKKEFINPFDNFENVHLNYDALMCIKKYGYLPVMKNEKWGFDTYYFKFL